MRRHDIPLRSLRPSGHATAEMEDGALHVTVSRAQPTERFDLPHLPINACAGVPGRFRMPLRIDLTAQIDVPGLYILLGDGHVNLGTFWADNRRLDDPVSPRHGPLYFDNHIPMNRPVTISLLYATACMQVLVDGELRYHSAKERYMRAKNFAQRNAEGFLLRIACDKGTNLHIHALTVTEYDGGVDAAAPTEAIAVPRQGNAAIAPGEKLTFEGCISLLPEDIAQALREMDGELRAMRPLKFRRTLERNGNKITYVASEHGFSYAVYPSGDTLYHTLQWYILTGSRPEDWYQKADHMEAVLDRLAQADPAFAERMFTTLHDCVGCVAGCRVPRAYTYQGKARTACHGKLRLTMRMDDLRAAMRFIREVNALAAGGMFGA